MKRTQNQQTMPAAHRQVLRFLDGSIKLASTVVAKSDNAEDVSQAEAFIEVAIHLRTLLEYMGSFSTCKRELQTGFKTPLVRKAADILIELLDKHTLKRKQSR